MGLGSSIKKATSSAGRAFKKGLSQTGDEVGRQWESWGRDTAIDATYGAYAGQLKHLLKWGGKESGHYNKEESASLGKGLGVNYQKVEADRGERIIEDKQRVAEAAFERKRIAEEARSRGQVAVRIRRGMRDNPSTKGGTIATSPTGLGSTGGFGAFASLLGL